MKKLKPGTAASCSTLTRPTGETRKKASSSLYLDELPVVPHKAVAEVSE